MSVEPRVEAATDRYPIIVPAGRGGEPTRVLKEGETFAVFDRFGDISVAGLGEHGIYHLGVRHLSRMQLRISGHIPLLLSSTVREGNDLLSIDLTNPDIALRDGNHIPRDLLHVFRTVFLWRGVCYERLRLVSYALERYAFHLSLAFDADFRDIFEVRGTTRQARGETAPPEAGPDGLLLRYRGLDDVERRTRIVCRPSPTAIREATAVFDLVLEPQRPFELLLAIGCESGPERGAILEADVALDALTTRLAGSRNRQTQVQTGNEQVGAWVRRSSADLHMMISDTPAGLYPYAGVPWFSTVFGRDGIITALQVLWADPDVARGVLGYLASTQATRLDPARDAEPGKILHEMRHGEMASLGEIPFAQYYGSVDATPLFVFLAGEYWRRTADRPFIESLWPAIERALAWMDTDGDPDRDGFLEYHRHSADGLVQQGWKDSWDSVFHQDGTLAEPPIALCEVQAYAYGARLAAAELARALGYVDRADALRRQAAELQVRFESAFWLDDLSVYALALDGRKRPCRVVSSNAGQCLATGIASPERAGRIAARLMEEDAFSGWGLRTIAWDQARYNPMAYHNGSVWPHDTALVAWGLSRYGMTDLAGRLFEGLYEASRHVDLNRLPELFCGFKRRPAQGPTLYPVACSPQAWAAGAVFMLLQACLGMTVDAVSRRITFASGQLPSFLPWLKLTGLRVGDAAVDLLLEHHALDLGIKVLGRSGRVEVVAVK